MCIPETASRHTVIMHIEGLNDCLSAVSSDRKSCVPYRHVVHQRKRNVHNLPIAPLPSSRSVHDFHKFGIHPNSTAPGFHFHLAGCINPDTGEMSSFTTEFTFILATTQSPKKI